MRARIKRERERVETRSNFFLLRFSSFSVSLAKATRALLKRETFSRVTHTEKISRFVSKIPNIYIRIKNVRFRRFRPVDDDTTAGGERVSMRESRSRERQGGNGWILWE